MSSAYKAAELKHFQSASFTYRHMMEHAHDSTQQMHAQNHCGTSSKWHFKPAKDHHGKERRKGK
eukprot:scaffold19149_cov18-Tisochrysis_lutea.AAC.1